MNITGESYGPAVILNIKGELTVDSLDAFQQAVDHQLASAEVIDLILNMENVPFIDSASLERLLDLQERLAERMGQVKFVRCDENIAKIFEMTRLNSTFEIFKDVPEAVKSSQA